LNYLTDLDILINKFYDAFYQRMRQSILYRNIPPC
jgi:hypothetical protein